MKKLQFKIIIYLIMLLLTVSGAMAIVEVPYYRENASIFWFHVELEGNQTINLTITNTSGIPANETNVFLLFDDFNDSDIDSKLWNVNGDWSESAGTLDFGGADPLTNNISTVLKFTNVTVKYRYRTTEGSSPNRHQLPMNFGLDHNNAIAFMWSEFEDAIRITENNTLIDSAPFNTDTNFHRIEGTLAQGLQNVSIDEVDATIAETFSFAYTTENLGFSGRGGGTSAGNIDHYMVFRHTPNTPTISISCTSSTCSVGITNNEEVALSDYSFRIKHNFMSLTGNLGITQDLSINSSLDNITDLNGFNVFTDGINVEAGNITVDGVCFSEINIDTIVMNVSFSNGTLAAFSINSTTLIMDDTQLIQDDNYTVELSCSNSAGDISFSTKGFNMTDTNIPTIIWSFPLEDNSSTSTQNQPVTIDFTGFDTNLFSVGVTCRNPFGTTILNFEQSGLTSNSIQVINTTGNITIAGVADCNVSVSDAHTKQKITNDDLKFIKRSSKRNIEFSEGNNILNFTIGEAVDDIILIKLSDRYTFEPILSNAKKTTLQYSLDCNSKLYYLYNSDYDAHFVCGNMWIDFVLEDQPEAKYKISQIGDYRAIIDISKLDKEKSFKSKSIGIINILNSHVNWTVEQAAEVVPADDVADAITEGIANIIFVVIWIAFLAIGIFTGTGLLIVTAGAWGMLMGLGVILSLGTTAAVVWMIINSVIIMLGVTFRGED